MVLAGRAPTVPLPEVLAEEIASRLGRTGQRLTGNRRALAEVLHATPRPLSIPEILDRRRDLAQSSVYRNLVVLEQARVALRIVTDHEFARYELAEELTGHHHHLICARCGAVEDVAAAPALERSVRSAAEQIARATGFHTDHHRIDLVGRCRTCA